MGTTNNWDVYARQLGAQMQSPYGLANATASASNLTATQIASMQGYASANPYTVITEVEKQFTDEEVKYLKQIIKHLKGQRDERVEEAIEKACKEIQGG